MEQLQEKSQSDFDKEWACWRNLQNKKDVGTELAYCEPASELLASSWDVIDSGLKHCGTVDKDNVRLTQHWHLCWPRKLCVGYRNGSGPVHAGWREIKGRNWNDRRGSRVQLERYWCEVWLICTRGCGRTKWTQNTDQTTRSSLVSDCASGEVRHWNKFGTRDERK